ncbi:MAG: PucR family transcriptional regulator ligand-binding domain-containing protein [Eubacterium sp.]|nr:PucR family transcriptional regulator ligand-binding domain-containing protein [Eubacterium sp.]
MALELDRLMKKIQHMDITLRAGEKGLNHLVSWVHMIETLEASTFLEGGEISIITGLGVCDDENQLLALITEIHKHDAAGVIVNIGPFIEEVPQVVLDFCNEHDLPLFTVPWKVHLAEIMRLICFSITKEDQRNLESASAFKNAMFFPDQEELYLVPLSQRNFNPDWKYAVSVMTLSSNSKEQNLTYRLERLVQALDHHARHEHYERFSVFTKGEELLIVVGNYTQDELIHFIQDMYERARSLLLPDEELTLGVGRLTKSIRCLNKSYMQACSIQNLQKNKKLDKNVFFYPQLGIYQLLLGIENRDILHDYLDQTLEPLIAYDRANDGDLCEVLKCYLDHNGSVKEAADQLYVHRNTVNYKLGKVSDILKIDLSRLDVRLRLLMAFHIMEMI